MPYLDGDNGDIADGEGIFIDPMMSSRSGIPGIFHIGKRIGKFPDDGLPGSFHWRKGALPCVLKKIIGPYIIQPGQMILMGMGIDDCVQRRMPALSI
jgi:hypothetical protein